MEKFTVAATQVAVKHLAIERNLETHLQLIEETARAGCQLVVFPELSVTGHNSSPDVVQFAEEADGRIFRALQAQAKQSDILVGYGFCELARGTHYNAYAVVGPTGRLGIQRKVHASHDEFFRFRQAYEWSVFDLGYCKAGITICHDTDFFESWRVLALMGADIILTPHSIRKMTDTAGDMIFEGGENEESDANMLAAQEQLFTTSPIVDLHRVMARSNAVYSIFSGQVGFDGHSSHVGGAYIVNPEGKIIARTPPSAGNAWVSAELDPQIHAHVRQHAWFALKKRRPETYGELTKQL
jgi:predicted amidohydrolase